MGLGVYIYENTEQLSTISISDERSNIEVNMHKADKFMIVTSDDFATFKTTLLCEGGSVRFTDIEDNVFCSIKISWYNDYVKIFKTKDYLHISELSSFNIEANINNQKIIKNYSNSNGNKTSIKVDIINNDGNYDIKLSDLYT